MTTLEPLNAQFTTFDAFMAGTMTLTEASRYIADNAQFQMYGLRKINPATGEGVNRYAVREIKAENAEPGNAGGVRSPRPRKVKAPGEVRNGVEAPRVGTVGAQTWAMFDDLWSIRKEPFTKSMMLATATTRGFNHGNVLTECSRWRKFHGMGWKP